MNEDKIILGIDPGTRMLGWGVVSVVNGRASYLSMGVVNIKSSLDHFEKLSLIFKAVTSLINKYKPNELAVEAPFYGKNIQSMLKLGRAQGSAISAALEKNLKVYEYAPRKVKLSITGKGAASKEQVAMVISKILNIKESAGSFDATDGLAVALCHFLSGTVPQAVTSIVRRGAADDRWSSFVKNNPDRIK